MINRFEYFIDVTAEGKLQKKATEQIARDLLKLIGKRIHILIKIKKKTRSNNQNRYYWGVIVECVRQCVLETWGEDIGKEEAHELIKFNCNYKEQVIEATGEIIRIPISTTVLNTAEAELMYDRARKWCYLWFNAIIPLPNEQPDLL